MTEERVLYLSDPSGKPMLLTDPVLLGRGLQRFSTYPRSVSRQHVLVSTVTNDLHADDSERNYVEVQLKGVYGWLLIGARTKWKHMKRARVYNLYDGDKFKLSSEKLKLDSGEEFDVVFTVNFGVYPEEEPSSTSSSSSGGAGSANRRRRDDEDEDEDGGQRDSKRARTNGKPAVTFDPLTFSLGMADQDNLNDGAGNPSEWDLTISSSRQEKEKECSLGRYTIAIPLLSVDGVHKFKTDLGAKIGVEEITKFLMTHRDPRLRVILVDYEGYDNINKYRKTNDPRFILHCSSSEDLAKMKSLGKPAHFVVNPTNWRFLPKGTAANVNFHKSFPELKALSQKKYRAAKPYVPYPVEVPEGNALRAVQTVHWILQIVPPNMNPNKPDCLKDDYVEGAKLLRQCYEDVLGLFYSKLGLPAPPKNKDMLKDVSKWSEAHQWDQPMVDDQEFQFEHASEEKSSHAASSSSSPSSASGRTESDVESKLHYTMREPPEYDAPDFNSTASGRNFNWANALLEYTKPGAKSAEVQRSIFYEDDHYVVIYDKYPKARHHLLVMPRRVVRSARDLDGNKALDVQMLKEMSFRARWIMEGFSRRHKSMRYRCGVHAKPSMNQLHFHIVSQDFDSVYLKNKKHWLSFTSDFFIDSNAVLATLEQRKSFALNIQHYESLLKGNLQCHRCGAPIRTMPRLKEHIAACKHPVKRHAAIPSLVMVDGPFQPKSMSCTSSQDSQSSLGMEDA